MQRPNMIMIMLMITGMHSAIAQNSNQSAIKTAALRVLQNKCNTCHSIHNRKKVFSETTMETHAANIYKQVFVKRRMPKGVKTTLTKEEETALLLWLKTKGVTTQE